MDGDSMDGRKRSEDLAEKQRDRHRRKNELIKIKETAVFTKRAAQDMASDNAKRARLEHEPKSQECYSKKHCH